MHLNFQKNTKKEKRLPKRQPKEGNANRLIYSDRLVARKLMSNRSSFGVIVITGGAKV